MSDQEFTRNSPIAQPSDSAQPPRPLFRKPHFRVLREDYLEFCGGNTVAALLLDYFASIEHLHNEAQRQGETLSKWRAVGGTYGGLIVLVQPTPSRETVKKALQVLTAAQLLEAHPDNGQPTLINQSPTPNRYRLLVSNLIEMEATWRGTPPHAGEGSVTQTTDPPATQMAHDLVVKEGVKERDAHAQPPPPPPTTSAGQGSPEPDHLTASDRREVRKQAKANDTFLVMNASTLSIAWAEAVGAADPYAHAEVLWSNMRNREAFTALAGQDCTADDLKALYKEKQRPGASYLLRFAVEDYPEWAAARREQVKASAPVHYVEAPDPLPPRSQEEIESMKAMRKARRL